MFVQEIQDSIGFRDRLMYIYTSGTTGMPKAAVIKHARYILARCVTPDIIKSIRKLVSVPLLISSFFSGGLTIMIGVRKEDTVYCPLPLYHRLNHHDIKMDIRVSQLS